ncbi:MAG: NADH-quinone oxidoreductase subunit M [Anaerolineales bacterium]|nr:NADH-quinone oxidoreductase subunit M [Anaerolineales bacterium]MCW5855186.1 NADH-quinone oxidoreductase subunit M [Anaerolineales bacterium]
MQIPYLLSAIVLLPILAGAVMLFLPPKNRDLIYRFALGAAFVTFLLTLVVYFGFDAAGPQYQFIEDYAWLPALGISFKLGVDGISAPLVLLTGVVIFTGVIISQRIEDRVREFFAFLFILASGVFGVFVALDMFALFFFYEIAVFPMYLLIAMWGWKQTREYAAMKLTLYLFVGSVVALVGALAMYFASGLNTFDMTLLATANFSPAFQNLWFPFVFFGFAVLGGIFPFHNWSPVGHVAAPTAVSMFHAGVLMKLGAFAALRVGIMLLPIGAQTHMWWIILLTLVNVVYGAFIAMTQTDFKYMIGYSSVSHMGLVAMGFATLDYNGLVGASVQMVSHGVMTALFFAVVGMIYDQAHTREIPKLGGLMKIMPFAGVGFIIGGLVSMGMPGFSGFIAEFPIFMGLWAANYPWIAIISVVSIAVTAAYILRAVGQVFFGELPADLEGHMHDVKPSEKLAIGILCFIMIAIGIYPNVIMPMVQHGVNAVLALLGGA